MRRVRNSWSIAALMAVAALAVAGCGGAEGSDDDGDVELVGYSTAQPVYEETVIPAFQKTPQGKGAEFSTSFGASGDQRRAVEDGEDADVVLLSARPDMTRLVDAGLVRKDWNYYQYKGMATYSVVVLAVRRRDPMNIEIWNDLERTDVDVVTPNPKTSGAGKWNLMAAYGSQIEQGRSKREALDFVEQVLANTTKLDRSARDAMRAFAGGRGDVLLTTEAEALQAQKDGVALRFIVPRETIRTETPIAPAVGGGAKARRFVEYVHTDAAQQLFADRGYRPVVKPILAANRDKFPEPPQLFWIEDLGNWDVVEPEFFGEPNGSITKIQRQLGR
jgi:sulfate/thiosulfate-binding protein